MLLMPVDDVGSFKTRFCICFVAICVPTNQNKMIGKPIRGELNNQANPLATILVKNIIENKDPTPYAATG